MHLVPEPAAAPGPALSSRELDAALVAGFGRPCAVTPSGRAALAVILRYLRLRPDDEVWITTTTGASGLAVTPCVTATIARSCRFADHPGPRTAAALVIHDWGLPHPDLADVGDYCRRHGLPLIEDAAHAFAGRDASGRRLGTIGDFALFSLPKFFPIAHGGLVAGLPPHALPEDGRDPEARQALAGWLPYQDAIASARCQTWMALDGRMQELGLGGALPLPPGAVPSLYLLRTPLPFATLARLRAAGIESGPDDHRGFIFLPCHQQVGKSGVARIVAAVRSAQGAPDHVEGRLPHR